MNNTLTNGLRLLEALAVSGEHHSVTLLAREMGLTKSGVSRLLATMRDAGFLDQEAGNRQYRVSLKVLEMANATLRRLGIRSKARPFIDKLARTMRQPTYLTVPHRWRPVVVDVVYPGGFEGDPGLSIGNVLPVHSSASGKVTAVYVPEGDFRNFISGVDFERHTKKTISEAEVFVAAVRKAKDDGYAVTDSERGLGVKAVAAPVFNCDGEFVGTIGVTLPLDEATDALWDTFIKATVETAQAISFALGYFKKNLV